MCSSDLTAHELLAPGSTARVHLIERRTAELMRCWQISLSAALLRGRLDMLARVRGKVFKTLVKKRSLQQHSWASSSHSVAVFLGRQGAFRGSS